MRPSFEVEAQKLAQIPDDTEDDGGVESALLKLEGKYDRKSGGPPSLPQSIAGDVVSEDHPAPLFSPLPDVERREEKQAVEPTESQGEHISEPSKPQEEQISEPTKSQEKVVHRHVHVGGEEQRPLLSPSDAVTTTAEDGSSFLGLPSPQKRRQEVHSFLSEDSHASYSSIPLLERGLMEELRGKKTATGEWTNRSILDLPEDDEPSQAGDVTPRDSEHPSYEFVMKTGSVEMIKPGESMPPASSDRPHTEQSFLDVGSDDEDNSDLSSELSVNADNTEAAGDLILPKQGQTLSISTRRAEKNPPSIQVLPSPAIRPPSPPMTLVQALQMTPPGTTTVPALQENQIWGEKPLPPTPDTTPTSTGAPNAQNFSFPIDIAAGKANLADLRAKSQVEHMRNRFAAHLPFILAFDSEVLAQQFTLIEKDALNEIDWKELIDMRWKNAEQEGINTRSWVSFLRDTDARGVEVVIARFNIMVKWAVSEVVLTQDREERARCIIKYIHTAAHCRRYRNFATTSQLTMALCSNEVRRLAKTWALVPSSDKRTLRDLETLISPTRNFYNMRCEMEGGGLIGAASADMGCIPFVGIYTHDLLFNAQRPSEIASSPTTAPLVNFERCRIAASVVKTLLRLLEASTRYSFQPIEGLTERCLWMSALTDDNIRKHSEALE
jgi:hypothetical protein